jgi:signal transduction histidine kinase
MLSKLELELMTPLLIGCAMDVQGTAAYRRIRVHVDKLSTDLLPGIAVDRKRISQVIVNLLDNGVKYADRGTDIVISAKEQESWAYIYVTDHGTRLLEEDVARIFERGYRTEEAEHRAPGGTGIGLFVAREIALLHEGDLYAEPSVYDAALKKHKVVFTLKLKTSV